MATIRVVQAILGFFIPMIVLITALFILEFFIEIALGLFAMIINQGALFILWYNPGFDTTPDFPGPLNLLNWVIGTFPSIWDIGTIVFFGGLEELSFFAYVFAEILFGLLGIALFKNFADRMKAVSSYAALKSSTTSGIRDIPQVKTDFD